MTLLKPFPLQNPSITFAHLYYYRLLDDLFSAGVTNSADFAVTQKAGGANMSVDVAAGEAIVDFTTPEGGKRLTVMDVLSNSGTPGAPNTPDWLTTFTAANGTNPRVDRVVLTVRDTDLDASGARDAVLQVVAGTATAGATLTNLTGAASVPANSLLLANVLIPAGATSITTANIDSVLGATRKKAWGGSLGQPAVRATMAVNQSLTSGTEVALVFGGTDRFDDENMHDTATNNTRLTCRTTGRYEIIGNVEFDANATGSRQARIRINGGTSIAGDARPAAGATHTTKVTVATLYDLAAGDFIELLALQDSGGALNVLAGTAIQTTFGMSRVG